MYWPMYRKTAPSLSSSASSRCLGTEQFSDTSANTFRVTLLPVAGSQPHHPSPWRGCRQAASCSQSFKPPRHLSCMVLHFPVQRNWTQCRRHSTRMITTMPRGRLCLWKPFFTTQHVSQPVAAAYCLTLVRAGFNYPRLRETCTNFQPPEPLNEGEPPETLYGHLLGCLREISFERYPSIVTDGIDHHTVTIVKLVLDHFSTRPTPTSL